MSIDYPARAFRLPSRAVREAVASAMRARRLESMKLSLVEMFGEAASAVARGQPAQNDVGGNSGICWGELCQALEYAPDGISSGAKVA